MFEDDVIVKLKKEQFVEAESVAYLIKDELKRKLAFANTCCLFAFKNYVEKNKYKYEPVTNINLFRVPLIAEKYGISDLYLGKIRVDVRVSLDGKVFPIPKIHIKDSLAGDYYVVYKGTKNPLKCEGIGYVRKEDLVFDSQDEEYYYISVAILNPLEELKEEITHFEKEEKTFYETEHRLAKENIGAFLDGDLDEVKSLDMLEHMMNCEECRSLFVEHSFLEDVLTSIKHYPDLKEDLDNYMAEKEPANEDVIVTDTVSVQEMTDEQEINDEILNIEEDTITDTYSGEKTDIIDEDEIVNDVESVDELDITDDAVPYELDESDDAIELENTMEMTEITENENAIDEVPGLVDETSNTENDFSSKLEYEEDINVDEPDEDTEDITPKIVLPQNEIQAENDEYSITESNEIDDGFSIESDDEELKNFIMDDINLDETSPINIQGDVLTDVSEQQNIQNEQTEISQETGIFDDNIISQNDKPVDIMENNADAEYNEKDEIIDFEDIFSDGNEIEISSNEVENIKNDEELKNILGEGSDTDSQKSEWNELFKEEKSEIQHPEESVPTEILSEEYTDDSIIDNGTEDIAALYDGQNNVLEKNDDIEQKIENESQKEKKPVNAAIFIGLIVFVLAIVVAGGFWYISSNFANKLANGNNEPKTSFSENDDFSSNDMNKVMTNAFSEENTSPLEITKMSWNKNKNATMTNELKEYLNVLASSIWDNLEENITAVRSNDVSMPSKILISVNKEGEVTNVKVAQSCGSNEVDSVVLKSVKNVLETMSPAAYSVKGENLNLTLVVNF